MQEHLPTVLTFQRDRCRGFTLEELDKHLQILDLGLELVHL